MGSESFGPVGVREAGECLDAVKAGDGIVGEVGSGGTDVVEGVAEQGVGAVGEWGIHCIR